MRETGETCLLITPELFVSAIVAGVSVSAAPVAEPNLSADRGLVALADASGSVGGGLRDVC